MGRSITTHGVNDWYIDFMGNHHTKSVDYYSQYARFFDHDSKEYRVRSVAERQVFLLQTQHYFNMKLRLEGRVLINDVYEALDLSRIPEYDNIGWIYNPDDATKNNYIDFGYYNVLEYVNGWMSNNDPFLLDFNVDGDILKYL